MMIYRYTYPLQSLGDNWLIKTIVASLGALISSDPQLIVLVIFLVILDTITGMIAAAKRKDKITSKRLSMMTVKLIEYYLLAAASLAVGNSFALLSWLPSTVFLYIALTELFSIFENVSQTNEKLKGYLEKIKKKINVIDDDEAE